MFRASALFGCIQAAAFASLLSRAWALDDKPAEPPPSEPPLEKLLELNARDIFGGETVIKDGRVTIKYLGKGQFNRGFLCTSGGGKGFVSSLDEIKDGAMRKSVSEGVEASFSFAAIDAGEAYSKFELTDDFKISFRARIPLVPPAGSFIVRVNQADSKNFMQTSFFQDLSIVEGGRSRRKSSADKRFLGLPSKWFLQKLAPNVATPVEIVYKEKKVSVFVTLFPADDKTGGKDKKGGKEKKDKPPDKKDNKVEVVSEEGIVKPSSGKIAFMFAKMSFGVIDLVIDGKYSKEWAEKEIARLRKNGELRLTAEEPEQLAKKHEKSKAKSPGGEKQGSEPERKARGGNRPPPNVDQPDPEAQVDL